MLMNKWISLGLNVLTAVLVVLSQVDWSTMLPQKYAFAGAMIVLVIKSALSALQPAPTQPAMPTGGTVITHS